MSLATSLLGGLAFTELVTGGEGLSYIGDALFTTPRYIGMIIPNVMVEEVNRDELEITQHPVEYGSPITDHSFMRPVEVMMRVGWSNAGYYPGYIEDVYQALLALQQSSVPFSVFTGKRPYNNMLMASLIQTTNPNQGQFTLMVQAMMRQVIIVTTSAIQGAPASAQEIPAQTGSTPVTGANSPIAATSAQNSSLTAQSSSFNDFGDLTPANANGFGSTAGQAGAA